MVRRFALSAMLLLGAAMLTGCANDLGAGTEAQSQRAAPAPGGFAVHLNSAVTTEAVVSSH